MCLPGEAPTIHPAASRAILVNSGLSFDRKKNPSTRGDTRPVHWCRALTAAHKECLFILHYAKDFSPSVRWRWQRVA